MRWTIAVCLLLLTLALPARAQSKPRAPRPASSSGQAEAVREGSRVRYRGLPVEHAEAIANIVDTVSRYYKDDFGLDMPERVTVLADLARTNRAGILANGLDQISLKLARLDQLKSPNESNVFNIYALCYELAELARRRTIGDAPWMTDAAADGLSYFLASEAIDRLDLIYQRKLWPDGGDYAAEGTRRMNHAMRNRNGPAMVQAAEQWLELGKLQGKTGIAGVLAALKKAHAEKKNVDTALADMPGANDVLGRPKVERWFKKFRPMLLVQEQKRNSKREAAVALAKNPVELKHDDDRGELADVVSGDAPAVYFKAGEGAWYLTEVRFFASVDAAASGSIAATLWLCDRNMTPVASWPIPPGQMRGTSPRWRTMTVKPTLVPAEYSLCIAPTSAGGARSASLRPSARPASPATRGKPGGKGASQSRGASGRSGGGPSGDGPASTTQPAEGAAGPALSGFKLGFDDTSKGHSAITSTRVAPSPSTGKSNHSGTQSPPTGARPFDRGDWMIRAKLDTARTDNPLLWRP